MNSSSSIRQSGNEQLIDHPYYDACDIMMYLRENKFNEREDMFVGLFFLASLGLGWFVIIILLNDIVFNKLAPLNDKIVVFASSSPIIIGVIVMTCLAIFALIEELKGSKRRRKMKKLRSKMDKAIRNVTMSSYQDVAVRELLKKFRHERRLRLFWTIIGYSLIFLVIWIVKNQVGQKYWDDHAYIFIPFTALLMLYWPYRMIWIQALRQYVKNLEIGDRNQKALEFLISRNAPFALYLRDFEGESDITDIVPQGVHMPPRLKISDREKHLLEKFAEFVPIFSFLNYRAMNWSPLAIPLNLVGSSWQETFIRYAEEATLIVIYIHNLSHGLEFELNWIEKNNAFLKSFFVLDNNTANAFYEKFQRPESSDKWITIISSNGQLEIPYDLLAYLKENNISSVSLFDT